jgi:hypothetical protein
VPANTGGVTHGFTGKPGNFNSFDAPGAISTFVAFGQGMNPASLRPGLPERQTHDYKRHGTTTLFAAFNILNGKVIGTCQPRHRSREFGGCRAAHAADLRRCQHRESFCAELGAAQELAILRVFLHILSRPGIGGEFCCSTCNTESKSAMRTELKVSQDG